MRIRVPRGKSGRKRIKIKVEKDLQLINSEKTISTEQRTALHFYMYMFHALLFGVIKRNKRELLHNRRLNYRVIAFPHQNRPSSDIVTCQSRQ